ncbi:TPA: restriction endonuclease subunit S [Haemophilus influenzae]|uniref:restriction endonuclease subunit S n=1 Tax=Haemophilus influenzae TaxID=727 RepID=UPI000D021928|nr:restriction endonuclease subunit S [Haemophilus influenzae]AXP38179.1 restriction endonuclease subunit S [Haemophilus influenzae]AXP56503.1 restriction endonuclease subunit S [Haemophilus influenzae]AXP66726.1 restriction endonuclease subunit S [Haemophilus influenzae]AYO34797.1 restriction endonuclease subunit S [Haemophilus influenzae]MCK9649945.1 restriction endonuclease subunit S [Haemophilus influenzae]
MSNQEFIPASEFCDLVTDGTHDSPKKTEFGVKLVTSKNIVGGKLDLTSAYFISESDAQNINKRSQVHINDVLLSMIGTVGEVALIEKEPDFVIKNVGLLKNSDPKKAKWLYYYLKSPITQNLIKDRLRGTTQQYIPLGELRNLPILKPNSEEHLQNTIEQLSSLDKKIQLNTQINQTLEQIAQALFKSWFVDFDPVRAKVQALSEGMSLEHAELAAMQAISGKTPEELTALLQEQPDRYAELAETAKAFPCEMVEVDGVEVPKGWEMKALSDLGQIICGKTPSKSNKEFYGDDVPFIKIPDMHNQVFITQTTDNLSVVGANYQSKKYIPAKSICVSCIATVGLVSMTSKPSHTNQQINSIIPDDEQSGEFLYLSLKQPSMTKYLKDLASGGTATLNLNTSTFSKIEIITPSKEIIYIFQKKVVSIFEKTLSNSIENKRLTEIRDLLLPRLLNGEI